MAANVFGARMQHEIGSMLEGILQRRRRKGRIHRQIGAPRMRAISIVLYIECAAGRVDGCFQVDEITFTQLVEITVQREDLAVCRSLMELQCAVDTVVSCSD